MRSAGSMAQLMAKEDSMALLRLPSGELRNVSELCIATVGQVGNLDHDGYIQPGRGRAGKAVRHLDRRQIPAGSGTDIVREQGLRSCIQFGFLDLDLPFPKTVDRLGSERGRGNAQEQHQSKDQTDQFFHLFTPPFVLLKNLEYFNAGTSICQTPVIYEPLQFTGFLNYAMITGQREGRQP